MDVCVKVGGGYFRMNYCEYMQIIFCCSMLVKEEINYIEWEARDGNLISVQSIIVVPPVKDIHVS